MLFTSDCLQCSQATLFSTSFIYLVICNYDDLDVVVVIGVKN